MRTQHKATTSKRKSTVFFRRRTQLTDFFQIPQILHARFRCMMLFTSSSPIRDFYFDNSERHILPAHAREHLRSCLHLTNPCAKRKVLSLTKPKGKIYETKSLGHYITLMAAVIYPYLLFFVYSSSSWIVASTQSSLLVSFLFFQHFFVHASSSSSSSLCHAASTDFPDSFSPFLSIINHFR